MVNEQQDPATAIGTELPDVSAMSLESMVSAADGSVFGQALARVADEVNRNVPVSAGFTSSF